MTLISRWTWLCMSQWNFSAVVKIKKNFKLNAMSIKDFIEYQDINSLHAGLFCMYFFVCRFFSKLSSSKKNLSGIPSECQTVWFQIWTHSLSGLMWVQPLFDLMLYVHGKQLKSCWDSTVPGQASLRQFTSIKCPFFCQ